MQNTHSTPRPTPNREETDRMQYDEAETPVETDPQGEESDSSSDDVAQTGTDLDFRPAA